MRKLVLVAALALAASACTKVETGHVGVRTSFNGVVDQTPLPVGFHQTFVGHVDVYTANQMSLEVLDLHPQTADKTTLHDIDVAYVYSVDPNAIPWMATSFKGRNFIHDGDIYPMGAYIDGLMRSAIASAVAKFPALEANDRRPEIESEIKKAVEVKLTEEQLTGKIVLHQVLIKALTIDPSLNESVRNTINQQNLLRAKSYEVDTARKEAERMQLLAGQAGKQYIDYTYAQAALIQAQAMSKMAEAKPQYIVVPNGFNGLMNMPKPQ